MDDANLNNSILYTIRRAIGGIETDDETAFDPVLIMHINTYIQHLIQLGVGTEGFEVTGLNETWDDFLGGDHQLVNGVKSYLYMKVYMAFDNSMPSSLRQALETQSAEIEWRLNVSVDRGVSSDE